MGGSFASIFSSQTPLSSELRFSWLEKSRNPSKSCSRSQAQEPESCPLTMNATRGVWSWLRKKDLRQSVTPWDSLEHSWRAYPMVLLTCPLSATGSLIG